MKSIKLISGVSLIEVLVSLFLLSIILLGLMSAQIYALKQSRVAWVYSVARHQLENMREVLIALQSSRGLAFCLREWNAQNKIVLPSGRGSLSGKFPSYQLTIYWGEKLSRCQTNQIGESGCLQENIEV